MIQDHVHMLIKIPPKYSVSEVIGYIEGKSAIAVAASLEVGKEILMGNDFGQEAMLYRQLVLRKAKYVITLRIKNRLTDEARMSLVNFSSWYRV